jgi:hypothetical protein
MTTRPEARIEKTAARHTGGRPQRLNGPGDRHPRAGDPIPTVTTAERRESPTSPPPPFGGFRCGPRKRDAEGLEA